jgi:H+-transporting ATPase
MVLTEPGLTGVVAAVREGRVTFQRIQTYTLNSIIKKIVTAVLLVFGLLMTGHAILTPLLMVILMIAGDFLAMSLTTDNVDASASPNTWRIGNLTMAGLAIGIALLAFCAGTLAIGKFEMHLSTGALQTLTFVTLVFGSQATLYAIRQRGRMWGARPSLWLIASSTADIFIAVLLAVGGIAMTSLPATLVTELLVAAMVFAVALDALKIPIFARLKIM